MMQAILKRLLRFQEMILILSISALACLPIALSNLIRDAEVSLLLPTTLLGAATAWLLAKSKVRNPASGIILLLLGPLTLFMSIGQAGKLILDVFKQLFNFIPLAYSFWRYRTLADYSPVLLATTDLSQRILTLAYRVWHWSAGLLNKTPIDDSLIRILMWSLLLWLAAIWAGWLSGRHRHLLLGILPSTVLLSFVLDYTGKEINILWLHLGLLFFVFGLHSFANAQNHWRDSNIDYADSATVDTLSLVAILSIVLVGFSFFSATISVKDILEDLRERRTSSNTTTADTIGLKPAPDPRAVDSSFGGMPRSHLVGSGPELSEELVMTIVTGDLPPMPAQARPIVPNYYWRALTYQSYTGSGWGNPSATSEDMNAEQMLFEPLEENIRMVDQQVAFAGDSEQLFWTGTLLRADVPFKAVWNRKVDAAPQSNPRLESDLLTALAPVKSYTASSMLLQVSADDLRNSSSDYPVWVERHFLQLPEALPKRVQSLARDLTALESNPYDRAIAIQEYLRQFPYTLEVSGPPTGRDVADFFLFDLKQGYCDYYASTMVVLARASGLPARLVIGYASGFYNYERAEYVVTENYAHSWVEIYFAGIGWVEFEPTANLPAIAYADEIKTSQTPAPIVEQPKLWSNQFRHLFQVIASNAWMPILGVLFILLSWFGWDAIRITQLDPAQTLQLLYKRLRRLARPLTGYVSRNQTVLSYSQILIGNLKTIKSSPQLQHWLATSHVEIDQLTELFSQSLFAPIPLTRADAKKAVKTWSRLRWKLLLANILRIRGERIILSKS